MAYDVINGTYSGSDFSAGLDDPEPARTEVWTAPQVMAFAELVEREIKHNLILVQKRTKAGTLDRREADEYAKFARSWSEWSKNEMKKAPTGTTVDHLKQWRIDNARWTERLSVAPYNVMIMRSVGVAVLKPAKQSSVVKKVFFGILGGLGLGWFIFNKKERA